MLKPYSTCDVAALSVVQLTAAPVLVIDPEETEMIFAGATTGIEWLSVLNSLLPEIVATVAPIGFDITLKM